VLENCRNFFWYEKRRPEMNNSRLEKPRFEKFRSCPAYSFY